MELEKMNPNNEEVEANGPGNRKKERKSNCEFCRENFDEFSSSTSLHGVQFLSKGSTFEKIFWFIMIVMSFTVCSIMIKKVWDKWNDTPVIVSFSETAAPIWQIPFPAVTICFAGKFDYRKFNVTEKIKNIKERGWEGLTETEKFEYRAAAMVCREAFGDHVPKENFTTEATIDFLKKVSRLKDKITVTWKRKNIMFNKEFNPITTSKGFCQTFNGLDTTDLFKEIAVQHKEYPVENRKLTNGWNLEDGYSKDSYLNETYPRRCSTPNINAGLSATLLLFKTNFDTICSGGTSGFKIVVHSPADLPNPSLEYFVAPIKQQMIITIKSNMITTSPELFSYEPERRQCFLSHERTLKYFKIYTMKNCEWECLSNHTFERCGCVSYWLPRESWMPLCSTDQHSCVSEARSDIEELEMNYQHAQRSGDKQKIETLGSMRKQCNCLPSCTSITYETEISQYPLEYSDIFNVEDDAAMASVYNSLHILKMRFSFKDSQFIPTKRSELYGLTDFIANCGGIMGLFLGFSFLSMIEIIYFMTIRPICALKNKKV